MEENFLDEPFGQGVQNLGWKNSFDVPMSLDSAGLDVYEFRIWCHLAKRAARKGNAWPSLRTMSEDLKISKPIVIRSLKSLQDKKLLKISTRLKGNGDRTSNLYVCLAPEQGGVVNHIDQGGQPHLPGVVNDVDQGGQPHLPGVVNDVDHKLLKEQTLKTEERGRVVLSDEEFIQSLKNDPAYKGVDVDREIHKLKAWLSVRPGEQCTRRRLINWLNRADRRIDPFNSGKRQYNPRTDPDRSVLS